MRAFWNFGAREPILIPSWLRRVFVRINEDIRKSVNFIGVMSSDGQFSPYGTGFLVVWEVGESHVPFLVTAKHVLDDAKSTGLPLVARATTKSGGVQYGNIEYENWVFHPTNPKCDVAVLCLRISHDIFDVKFIRLNPGILTPEYVANNDVGAGDEVFVAGLLARHFGRGRNIPVIRTGTIAAMPEEPVDLGGLGEQEVYLIESRSIGGLSGSPVFLHTPPFRVVGTQVQNCVGHDTEYLLGINIGLFKTNPVSDQAPSEKLAHREEFLELMSSGIAVVVPIQRVVETIMASPLKEVIEAATKGKDEARGFVQTSALESVPDAINPGHKEDFMRLLSAAAKAKPQGGQT
jgi:hypothetical protein